jgi:uncharacterized protein YjiS (DUF1127 family)
MQSNLLMAPAAPAGRVPLRLPPQHAPARPARASLLQILATLGQATAETLLGQLRHSVAQWRRQQQVRRTAAALRALDRHTLRDLGIHEAEAMSVAVEAHGVVEATRSRVLLHRHWYGR